MGIMRSHGVLGGQAPGLAVLLGVAEVELVFSFPYARVASGTEMRPDSARAESGRGAGPSHRQGKVEHSPADARCKPFSIGRDNNVWNPRLAQNDWDVGAKVTCLASFDSQQRELAVLCFFSKALVAGVSAHPHPCPADPAEILEKRSEKGGDTLYYVHYLNCRWS